MTLGRAARTQLNKLVSQASLLEGDFFRSVAFQYFHPDDVINGEGTRIHGGRFVPVGVPEVYASMEEDTALREAAARQLSLRGQNQIEFSDYPRLTYVLRVRTERNIDLSSGLGMELQHAVTECLKPGKHTYSQQLAAVWIAEGIESVVFPSATGLGRNVAVYIAKAGQASVIIFNRDQIVEHLYRRLL